MRILGIETSCDETAAAVVKDGTKILSNVVASSSEMHAKTGGIIPEQAARQQVRSIVPVISQAISEVLTIKPPNHATIESMAKWLNGQMVKEIDAIAVTVGPGLIGSLLVGVETAKTLAHLWNKPIIPVNHLVAHIYANFIRENSKPKTQNLKLPQFPALCLVVSGGHTDLVLMEDHPSTGRSTTRNKPSGSGSKSSGQALRWLGGTRDDAAGEAFDKTARLLELPYPGGPAIAAEAAKFEAQNPKYELRMFPRPIIGEDNYDWSFSGLKTAVLRRVKEQEGGRVEEKSNIQRLAAEIQEAIVDVLVIKTLAAAKKYKPKTLLVAGGVAANMRLREKFKLAIGHLSFDIDFRVPPPKLCTDNAVYIATCGYFNYSPVPWQKIVVNPQLTITGQA
jgi:N6-L-threonylcarbamoyladenine synthase